ncbi:hypothetical protein [Micromonospora sp. NBC_01739]|uniref:hypothetical protein n=1 Tax=Micromonospora sp. NBC_01739 TaxID=2975985 RepID=UPI002E117EBB|nr:hypothetical protein OIE53_03060 [Micromonospora sp. NBC_01739]
MRAESKREADAMNTTSPSLRRKATLAGLVAAGIVALGCAAGGDIVAYDLPPESARYTFEAETNGVKTVWEYTSGKATEGDVSELQPCMGDIVGGAGECRPEPLIFLRYDLGLDLDNTVKAGSAHQVTIIGYYQERLSTPPKVTDLRVEVSFDGGRSWQPAPTKAAGKNTYTATVKHPKRGQAAEGVGLRISAADSGGNTVKQTIPTAYTLR